MFTKKEHAKRSWQKLKSNPERLRAYREKRRVYNLSYSFGITIEQYEALLEKQNNKCGICKTDITQLTEGRRLAVDHCHSTGQIRGLLCMRCNTALGKFNDNVDLLVNAIAYLIKTT